MKKIYVAGPYTASTPRETQQNVDKAIAVGCELIHRGWAPFIPHLSHYIWLHPKGDFGYEVWTALDFKWLEVCDAFFFIAPSNGADAELEVAKKMGIPIYYNIEHVPDLTGVLAKDKILRG